MASSFLGRLLLGRLLRARLLRLLSPTARQRRVLGLDVAEVRLEPRLGRRREARVGEGSPADAAEMLAGRAVPARVEELAHAGTRAVAGHRRGVARDAGAGHRRRAPAGRPRREELVAVAAGFATRDVALVREAPLQRKEIYW